MPADLIDLIFLSEKRENVLLLLLQGPADINRINEVLDCTSASILPQIKKLKDAGLVSKSEEGIYDLTMIGRLVCENMRPLSTMLQVLDPEEEYWAGRDLDMIPPELLDRLGELGEVELIVPDLDHLYDLHDPFVNQVKASQQVRSILSLFHPDHPGLYLELEKKTDLHLIFTRSVYQRWLEDFCDVMRQLTDSKRVLLFVCEDDVRPPAIHITDNVIYLSFFDMQGQYDHKDVLSTAELARKWAYDLFEYFRQQSLPVK